jgi:aminopeptidase 2
MRRFYNFTTIFFFLFSFTSIDCQNYRLSNVIVPKHYDLFIRTDLDLHTFSGNVTIDVHVNNETSLIQMHNIGLTIIGKVIVSSGAESNAISQDNVTQIMSIHLNRALPANSDHLITISFSGRIENDLKGLYMSTYYDNVAK